MKSTEKMSPEMLNEFFIPHAWSANPREGRKVKERTDPRNDYEFDDPRNDDYEYDDQDYKQMHVEDSKSSDFYGLESTIADAQEIVFPQRRRHSIGF